METQVSLVRKSARKLRRIASNTARIYRLGKARQLLCNPRDLSPDQLDAYALEHPMLPAEKEILRRVSLSVDPRDSMYQAVWCTSYLTAGISAGRCIQASLDAAHKVISRGTILDFPCGFGRVLRYLKEMFPNAAIVGSEIDPAMVEFCQRTFSVQGHQSNPARRFRDLTLPGKFDLIWCGSLVTHIDERATTDLLYFFYRHLAPGGVCVFTTHGRHVAGIFERRDQKFNLSEEGLQKAEREYRERGYGYSDYPWDFPEERKGCHGISLSTRAKINELAQSVGAWHEVYFRERGWHRLQDVYAFMSPTS